MTVWCANCQAGPTDKHAWGCPLNPNRETEVTAAQILREREEYEAQAAEEYF